MEYGRVCINRCKLLPKLDITTPNFIIDELAKFESIQYNKIKLVNSYDYKNKLIHLLKQEINYITIKKLGDCDEYKKTSLGVIANFLNYDPKITWNIKEITQTFKKVVKYYDHTLYESLDPDFEYGKISSDFVNDRVDVIMCYGACLFFGITDINEQTIETKLRNYLNLSEYKLKKNLLVNIDTLSKSEMYNLLTKKHLIYKSPIDYVKLTRIYINMKTLKNPNYIPKTNEEAISLAAILYRIDISGHGNPLLTMGKIKSTPQYKNMCRKLSVKFNPKLPRSFYTHADLMSIINDFGYSYLGVVPVGLYNICLKLKKIPNFKHGIRDKYSNILTFIYKTPVKDLYYDDCVTYGDDQIRYIYTYKELYEVFRNYNNLVMPNNIKKRFSDINIRKLTMICSGKTILANKNRKLILKKIKQIISSQNSLTKSEKFLVEIYKQHQSVIITSVVKFVEMAMYMRCWDGKSDYPLKSEDTLVENFEKLRGDVSIGLANFIGYINNNKIDDIFMKLPLVNYVDGVYVNSTNKSKGITIGDRIKILDDFKNINSCIRTSSNWFLASASKIGMLLGLNVGFDINNLSKIA